MRKFFTLFTAIALSLTVANAQNANGTIKNVDVPVQKIASPQMNGPRVLNAHSTPNRIEMEQGEHLMGFYQSDDLDFNTGGYGMNQAPGIIKAGAIFDYKVLDMYIGGQITKVRFGLVALPEIKGFYIYEVSTKYKISEDPIAYVDLSDYTPVIGWNEVTLPEPVTIEDGKYYLLAYEYVQGNGSDNNSYPITTDYNLKPEIRPQYGFVVYGDWTGSTYGGVGEQWISFANAIFGSICIQAVVKGGKFIDDDIQLSGLSAKQYAGIGGPITYKYSIMNKGNRIPQSYELNVCIDGTVVQTLESPVELTSAKQTVEGELTIPTSVTPDTHTLSIEVATINGVAPTQNTNDDVLQTSFIAYEGNGSRQMHLIEQFTSTMCGWCHYGDNIIDMLMNNNPGKYALAAIHCPEMGDDPFYLTDGTTNDYEYYAMPYGRAFPSAAINRYLYNDNTLNSHREVGMSLGFYPDYHELVSQLLDELVNSVYDDIPAFASVDITSDYDASTRQLSIKVSGDGITKARDLLNGQVLTIYLTEDGLIADQVNYDVDGELEENHVHNNVLRKIVSYSGFPWGDPINWTSDQTYENDYTVTLDDNWNPDNMHVIAFITKPFVYDQDPPNEKWNYYSASQGYVNNTNMVKLSNSTGISKTVSDPNATEVARYTTDGRQISSPVKGLNIVKMSDGTARKVIVR